MLYSESELQNLVEVARMYYEDNLTQAEIAKKFRVSRPLVSKMLSKARELGIVTIEIKNPYTTNSGLLDQLRKLFNIQGGIIVPESKTEYLTEQLIINHTFNYLKEMLPKAKNIGLGWGNMIASLIEKIENTDGLQNFHGQVCPLIGNAAVPYRGFHPNEMVRVFAERTGFKPNYLYAPAFPTSQHEKELFMNTDNFKNITEIWSQLDTIFISIGNFPSVPDEATALRFGKELTEKKAVGMMISYYFDKNGNFIEGQQDYAIHIPLESWKKVNTVIAVSSSTTNINSLMGALKTGYITHLITNERTAAEIIKYKI